jgi:tRNA-specific 2-thiouridylase
VTAIDAATDRVVVGPRTSLARGGLEGVRTSWVAGRSEAVGTPVDIRIRYRHRGIGGHLEASSGDRVRIRFDDPEDAVSPGQAAVFYRGSKVLGGTWIARALPTGIADEEAPSCA